MRKLETSDDDLVGKSRRGVSEKQKRGQRKAEEGSAKSRRGVSEKQKRGQRKAEEGSS